MAGQVVNVPNTISAVRLVTVVVFWMLLARDHVLAAGAVVFVIGSTDWLDGYLARRLNQTTKLGAFLDPLADRLMVASAIIGGLMFGVVPGIIGWPLVAREVFVAAGGLWARARGMDELVVRSLGKVATFILYGSIPSFYALHAGFMVWFFGPAAWISAPIALILYWWVGFEYLQDMRRALTLRAGNLRLNG